MKFAKHWKSTQVRMDDAFQDSMGTSLDVKVWGASNESPQAAEQQALKRAQQLKDVSANGFKRMHEYDYWLGYVREEVLEELLREDGSILAALTRNSYGATVINTDQVLFGDIDVDTRPRIFEGLRQLFGRKPKDKAFYTDKVKAYQQQNSHLSIKLYETCAGLRFVILNKLYKPEDAEVAKLFSDLGVDRMYQRLCKHQEGFRARLTPKPWRIGLLRPESRFPHKEGQESSNFKSWLRKYELSSHDAAVCKEVAVYGDVVVHDEVKTVLQLHDRYACVAAKPLA